ncbi:MAG TPA: phage tail tip lysozyme [Kofleriaceae bacterium]|nr:phage tail tip lysozyme [Kofleriaceae bacterium]
MFAASALLGACATPAPHEGDTDDAVTAFANDQTAYQFFVTHGLSPVQAAGIVGNLDQESGVNPNDGGGFIAQWGGSRLSALIAYATAQGEIDPSTGNPTLEAQLQFIMIELPSNGLADLQAATDLDASDITKANAAVAFMQDYERCLDDLDPAHWNDPGTCLESKRVGYAQSVLASYGNEPPPSPPLTGILPNCNQATITAYAPISAQPFFNEAWAWVDAQVPYAEKVTGNPTAGPYRSDCSGFVSSIWGLAPPGETTYNFAPGSPAKCGGGNSYLDESVAIAWSDLTPGDALNFPGDSCHVPASGHIMLFAGWLDAAHTEFCAVEEYSTGHPASIRAHSTSELASGWQSGLGGTLGTIFHPIRKAGYTPSGSPQGPAAPTCTSGPCRVGIALTADGNGYWEAASDGGVFSYGDAVFHGSMGATKLARPVVGIAPTPKRDGYWLVASDGGVFSFGDAGFFGSLGGIALAKPVVGMAATPTGKGYWLVAADGGVFSFGDAAFHGSLGGTALAAPIVGMAATPSGKGYWLAGADGGVFSFGDAAFHGSLGATKLARPISAIAASSDGQGYWLLGQDGGVFTFGDAVFYGSLAGQPARNGVPALVSASAILPVPSGGYYVMDSNAGTTTLFRAGYCGADIHMSSLPQNVEYVHSSAGAFEVQGAIRATWDGLAADCSSLGLPLSDELAIPVGQRNNFQGGFIVHRNATNATGAWNWPGTPACGIVQGTYQGLRPGQSMKSCDGHWMLVNQGTDGNLALYKDGVPQWGAGTTHDGNENVLYMQSDGNLVVYDINMDPIWASGTSGHPGAYMALQSDGNIVIYDHGAPLCARFGYAPCTLPHQ